MRILATVTEPAAVKKILAHLGVRTEPLPRGRARDPTGQTGFDFDAAYNPDEPATDAGPRVEAQVRARGDDFMPACSMTRRVRPVNRRSRRGNDAWARRRF